MNKGTSLEHSENKNLRIWNIREGWQTAIEENGYMRHHQPFELFEDAIKRDFKS